MFVRIFDCIRKGVMFVHCERLSTEIVRPNYAMALSNCPIACTETVDINQEDLRQREFRKQPKM